MELWEELWVEEWEYLLVHGIVGVTMERPRGEGRIMEEAFGKAIGGNPGAVGGAIADRGGFVGRVIGAHVGMLGGAVWQEQLKELLHIIFLAPHHKNILSSDRIR